MAKEQYVAYTFGTVDEIFLALMSIHEFVSFEERETEMVGYIAESELTEEVKEAIATTCAERNVSFSSEIIEQQNWNAQWEASFQPVDVGDFCRIRADFHESSEGIVHDIIINPKMAFGTGHHETTYMMINAMKNIDFDGKSVFDFGCGTGILAVLAEKLGAKTITAIDIEEESYDNTVENANMNGCTKIKAAQGTINDVNDTFDVILANINRHVLLDTANDLHKRFNSNGVLVISGILLADITLVTDTFMDAGFKLKENWTKGNWTAIKFLA